MRRLGGMAPEPQPMLSQLTEAAIFLVLTVDAGGEDGVRELLADVSGLKRSVGFRIPEGELTLRRRHRARRSGIGCSARRRPAGLHPFAGLRRRAAHRARDHAGRPAVPHPRPPPRPLLRAGAAPVRAGSPGPRRWSTRCTGSGPSTSATCSGSSTGPRTPRATRPRRRSRSATRIPTFAGGSYVDRAEVPPRPRRLGRAAGRGAGAGDRPHEARATSSWPTTSSPPTRTSR